MQNLFIIGFNSGIGEKLMPLFHLRRLKTHAYLVKWKAHIQDRIGYTDWRNIKIADREICFVVDEEYKAWIENRQDKT